MEMFLWLFFAYSVGSMVTGYLVNRNNYLNVVENTIDKLIEDGYIKTRGFGKDLELLKHTEWENNG